VNKQHRTLACPTHRSRRRMSPLCLCNQNAGQNSYLTANQLSIGLGKNRAVSGPRHVPPTVGSTAKLT
jgi:hypothetical protein